MDCSSISILFVCVCGSADLRGVRPLTEHVPGGLAPHDPGTAIDHTSTYLWLCEDNHQS